MHRLWIDSSAIFSLNVGAVGEIITLEVTETDFDLQQPLKIQKTANLEPRTSRLEGPKFEAKIEFLYLDSGLILVQFLEHVLVLWENDILKFAVLFILGYQVTTKIGFGDL